MPYLQIQPQRLNDERRTVVWEAPSWGPLQFTIVHNATLFPELLKQVVQEQSRHFLVSITTQRRVRRRGPSVQRASSKRLRTRVKAAVAYAHPMRSGPKGWAKTLETVLVLDSPSNAKEMRLTKFGHA